MLCLCVLEYSVVFILFFFVCGLPKNFPLEHVGSCVLNLSSVTVDFTALCRN